MAATPSTNVLSLMRHNQQDPGVDRPDVRPAAIDSVGVVGAGVMGCAIAAVNLQHEIPVTGAAGGQEVGEQVGVQMRMLLLD